MIAQSSPWRDVADTPYVTWERVISAAGGPPELASVAAHQAAQPHSGIALAQLGPESSMGTDFQANSASNRNAWNLKLPQGGGYVRFPTWVEGVAGWKARVTSGPEYKDGIYSDTETIRELIFDAFAPPSDGNDSQTYVNRMVSSLNAWQIGLRSPAQPHPDDPISGNVYGRVPHPPYERHIVPKLAPGQGYTLVAPRQIVGMCWHEWLGRSTLAFHKGFFACPHGERCLNALVDAFIMPDGHIVMINDPLGTRSPHASGGGGGLEGDGPAFVARFGIGAINSRLMSVEMVKLDREPYTPAQIEAGGRLAAHYHDRDGQPWQTHPYVPKYNCVTSTLHFELSSNTSCGRGEIGELTKLQAVTKAVMREGQGGTLRPNPDPIPPQVPPQPPPAIPGGISLAEARVRFGKLVRVLADGTDHPDGPYPFNWPAGIISQAWAYRAAQESEWPAAEHWYTVLDSGLAFELVTFSNDWRLFRASERDGFQWLSAPVG